ncbi:glycoside hydrolase [Pseudomonas sp. NPDC087358]|uniref:glycoside hydrolase n=1 Tax=Pseudomonas sp. NPDC087358 TaxID=3364439 RepID=UPI00384BF8BB
MLLLSSRLRHLLCFCAWLFAPLAGGATLENDLWRVELDPATLAIQVVPAGQSAVQASRGVSTHRVSRYETDANRLVWQWDEGAWLIEARLEQRELLLTVEARDPGVLELLDQPPEATGKALIWPLAEGHYVPRGDGVWQRFLSAQGELNTTQDLSLPLWGMHHEAFSLTWLLTNPFNNRLQLKPQQDALAISLSHEFTSLDVSAPMTLRLYLGDADPLAGARRYRQWLIDNGTYQTLDEKFNRTPDGRKLLGATHVYLWGNDLLGPADVRSWKRLVDVLGSPAPLAVRLRGHLDREAGAILDRKPASLQHWEQAVVLRGLNAAVNALARQGWQHDALPDMQRLASGYGELRKKIAQLFTDALIEQPSAWGGTLSEALIRDLRAAGLSGLWLGLGEGWEGGLWHPEAVRAAVRAGYLIAPYDSYQTALSAGENPEWTTAHLGGDAHRYCAVVLRDGTFKSGFQQSGHYTDPHCVRPLLEARIEAIRGAAGFNSWFLDAYATAMVFDSYRRGATMTQAQNAAGNIDASRWVAETQEMVAGSEDGNALTAEGILFAHGMQTPVIGWGDPQLNQNSKSSSYMGSWYPPEQPGVFFNAVPIKEPYHTVHFDPTTRLPLYQSVFHGSIITTHHWLFDSLKLSNVRTQNELTQLLYNVPPLYHLSRATLHDRLQAMQRQDAFFKPLHERLGNQAMTRFDWLTEDRQVQRTTFADGTRLVANFDGQMREVDGQWFTANSITAIEPDGAMVVYQSQDR